MRACLLIWLSLLAVAGCGEASAPESVAPSAETRKEHGRPNRHPQSAASRRVRESRTQAGSATTRESSRATEAGEGPAHVVASQPAVQPVYRRSDDRPRHDDAALAERGIRVYASKRLKLYTDIAPETARTLPPVIDAAYDEWVGYFGPLPPNREGTEYQITACIMAEPDLFRESGLLPDELPAFFNGRHWNDRLWMHDQPFDYYRRHLLIHEATHCFMTATRDMQSLSPVWYIEGIAELFGTHRIEADGTIRFRVMPRSAEEVADSARTLGRIEMIQKAVADGRSKPLRDVLDLRPRDFSNDEAYAWSWALCKLLDTHPRYRERFRRLGESLSPRAFEAAFTEWFADDLGDLRAEWTLFVHSLQHGYDIERAAVEFRAGAPFDPAATSRQFTIAADRGWQSSGVWVEAGRTYVVTATGRVTLADEPKPWPSEPQGISFRYFGGRPLGLLLAAIRSDADQAGGGADSMLDVLSIGRGAQIQPAASGTLYLRVNDSWSELADNRGSLVVEVAR